MDWPLCYWKGATQKQLSVAQNGTNKTQLLHRMRMRQFTPRQRPTDIRIAPQKWKPDPQVSVKHDEFFVGAWECEYKKSIFGAAQFTRTSSSVSFFNIGNVEHIRTRTGVFPRNFSSVEQLCVVTDTYPDMEPDVETSSEQPNYSPQLRKQITS